MDIKNKVIVITGASSGIGRECALLFRGDARVYALSRRCETGEGDGVCSVRCDVTSRQSVHDAIEYIIRREGGIDALICCAGAGIAGAVEDTSEQEMHALFEVNYFGTVRCAQEVMPHMRRQKSGTIVFISSVAALFGIPFQAFYSAGKYALAGTCEALRGELAPFNVKVCCIAPGDIKTGFTASRQYTAATEESTDYKPGFCSAVNSMVKDELTGAEPLQVAKLVRHALLKKNPPPQIISGADYKLLAFARRLLPNRFVCWALNKIYCCGKTQSHFWSFEHDVLKQPREK